jgi:hypothetical protein
MNSTYDYQDSTWGLDEGAASLKDDRTSYSAENLWIMVWVYASPGRSTADGKDF